MSNYSSSEKVYAANGGTFTIQDQGGNFVDEIFGNYVGGEVTSNGGTIYCNGNQDNTCVKIIDGGKGVEYNLELIVKPISNTPINEGHVTYNPY